MTATHIAFAAAAGATSLALMTTLLAWRMRARFLGREDQLRGALAARDAAVGELDSAINAYDETVLAIDGEQARLVWNEEALIACGKVLGLSAPSAADLLAALAERSPDAATALRDLVTLGRACRVEVFAEGATLIIDGRPSGATAWVRVALGGGAGVSLTSGPFALMAEQLPAPCWIVGRDGQLLWANKAWLAATEAGTLLTARDQNLSLDKSAETLVQDAASQNARKEAFRWIAVLGRRRAFRMVAEPLIDGAVAAYALDVTEVEETQDALRRHVKAHDETLDRLADGVAIFGPEKRLAFHNRAFESLWALDAAWLSERPAHGELLDRLRQKRKLPETIDYSAWKLRELSFYSLSESAADEIWSLPDGRSLRVVRQPHPLGGLLLLFSDITGELRLKAQYNSLIQVQRATLDQLYDAVAVFGADGRLRLRNAAFARFWNLDPAVLFEAMDYEDLARDCQRLLNDTGYWQDLKARITDPNPEARVGASGEMRLADKRIMTWRTQPLPDGATLVAFLDITATRALEDAVEARERALSESVRLKRDFVGNVSYELRTPLTTIVGYADMLKMNGETLPDKARDYLDSIQAAATQLARSIDDVLDMAQIDAGEMGLSMETLSLGDVVQASVKAQEEAASKRRVRLTLVGLEDAGSALIRADARRLSQIVSHLIDNALRSAPEDTTVDVRLEKGPAGLKIDVTDHGRGIPFHVQAHIFDRFVGRERGGPGLGLALVKALVELHGGWVALESEPGKGATFSVHLPRYEAVSAA